MIERGLHHSLYELLQQDQYTPEEVAAVLWIGIDVVRHAAFTGELPAQIIEHDIISLQRVDVLAWLKATEAPTRYDPLSRDTNETEADVSGTTRTSATRATSTTS